MIHQDYRENDMTIEIKVARYPMAKAAIKTTAPLLIKRRSWIHCPRCIGGNMYLDTNGEFICIQCGCSSLPDAVTKVPVVTIEQEKTESNLFTDISNALRAQRNAHP